MGWSRSWVLACVGVAALASSAMAQAEANPARGKTLSYTCLGCHAIENYKNAYPNYRVPRLRGQHPEYIVAALKGYKNGERSHGTMHAQASTLSDQDMEDIAAYVAGAPVKSTGKTVGAAPPQAQVCVSCHGPDGVGIVGDYPSLAGQYEDYIERALLEYRRGGRKNAVMATFAGQLKDADIKVLAAYYSSQKPGVSTLPMHGDRQASAK